MPSEFRITCINKPDRNSTHEHITHIGNLLGKWKLTREAAIRRIESKQESYYVQDDSTGKKAYVGVVNRSGGQSSYLRTYADNDWNDNLLSLPECNGDCKILE